MSRSTRPRRQGRRRDGVDSDRLVGWTDDIVAPRQEVSVVSMLYEAAAMQRRLDEHRGEKEEVSDDDLLAFLQRERHLYRRRSGSGKAGPKETSALTGTIELFGEQAAAAARHATQRRALLQCVGPDRRGAIAEVTAGLGRAGGNIEGAMMSVVAGYLVTNFLVSGLEQAPKKIPDNLRVDFSMLESEDVDWPRPRSSCWHARGEVVRDASGSGEDRLVLALTEEIAGQELPLVNLASRPDQETKNEIVDLNFAVAPEPPEDELRKVRDLEEAVARRVPSAQIDIFPAGWPTHFRSREAQRSTNAHRRDLMITVFAHARPGFVHAVLRLLSHQSREIEEVRGAAMAILEGTTVLNVVVRRTKHASPDHLRRFISGRLDELGFESSQVQVVNIGKVVSWATGEHAVSEGAGTTHELRLQVPEQPGVVRKVAELLWKRKVNITWFVCRVQEAQMGRRWPICDIQMHLAEVPEGDDLSRELRALTESEGWDEASLTEWSLADWSIDR